MKNKILTKKDICIIIATYNRPDDIDKTLSGLIKNENIPRRIIVVDQSKDERTKQVVGRYSKKVPIKYIFSKIPSSSISKNIGITLAKKKFKIIMILDDDVDLLENYFKNALSVFNENKNVMGLGGIEDKANQRKTVFSFTRIFRKIFFLPYLEEAKFRIVGPYGNTFGNSIKNLCFEVQWLPGFNMVFRKEVFNEYALPESIGYNVLEDIDSSYYVFKKFGKNSLVINPFCKTVHRFSSAARYAEKKRIFVNHEDHFYFYYTYFYPESKSKFVWSMFGILLGLLIRTIAIPKMENWLALKYNIQAIDYCIKNRAKIKDGKLRGFLNQDRSMKKEYL